MKRRKFLQNTCPTITFAFFGLSFIQACSKSDDDSSSYSSNNLNVTPGNSSGTNSVGSGTQTSSGIVSSGNNITIDLTNSNFSSLSSPGDFINLTSVGVLLLKISSSEFRAFDNCCPHSGTKDDWSYSNQEFTCGSHGNKFGIDGNNIVNCSSAATSGDLKNYSTSLAGDSLTITTS
mgnify:FL=1|tara:strand:- start:539 stop:1069 length:531 start_codon:yes stop_codon:yes gene_type:complete